MAAAPGLTKFIVYAGSTFVLSPHVPEPDGASVLLAGTMRAGDRDRVADLGTGSGFLGIMAAQAARRVVATDLNVEAVRCARRNVALNGCDERVEVRCGAWYEPLAGERFDLIVSNPPQMPTPVERESGDWMGMADSGGQDGRSAIDDIIAGAAGHLRPGGRICLAQHGFLDLNQTRATFEAHGLDVQDVVSVESALGRLSRERFGYAASLSNTAITKSGPDYAHHIHVVTGTRR